MFSVDDMVILPSGKEGRIRLINQPAGMALVETYEGMVGCRLSGLRPKSLWGVKNFDNGSEDQQSMF